MATNPINKSRSSDIDYRRSRATAASDKQTGRAGSVTQIVDKSTVKLRQLWRELGISGEDQAGEEDAILRDVKSLYERKVQFYQDEHELSSKRIAVLQREIAHIRWLFRDDEPHEFGDEAACSIRDKLASLEVKFKCLEQIRESRMYKLSTLENELSQLLVQAGEDDWSEQHQKRDDGDDLVNLSEMKVLSIQARIDYLRPLVEGLAKKIAEDTASCGNLMMQLGTIKFSDFDRALLHSGEKLSITLQSSLKVSARLRELQTAVDEAASLRKLVGKRESILLERCEYNQAILDSLRLTSRTGDAGRLLREEKLRRKISKDLPKLTSVLEKNIAAWEQKYAMQFIHEGNAYLSHMRAVDSEYEAKAEEEREKKNRSQQLLRTTSASIGNRDENKKPSRLRRRNSVSTESVPSAKGDPHAAAVAPRRRRFSVDSEHIAPMIARAPASS